MSLPVSSLQGVGSGGGGQYESTTKSSSDASGTWYTGAGNRGYQLNIAFPGADLSLSEPINQPMVSGAGAVGSWVLWAVVGLIGVAVFLKLKGRF